MAWIVKCPKCGWKQKTYSNKIVRCIRCGHSYKVFPKNSKSRVVGLA